MSLLETRLENAVLAFLLENAPVAPTATTFRFSCSSDPTRTYRAASAKLACRDEELSLVFTLASHGRSVFLTITDGPPQRVAGVLAQIEDYDTLGNHLHHGDTLRLDGDQMLESNGRVAVALLRPCVSHALPEFPDTTEIENHSVRFHLVVFLDEDEYAAKLAGGLDGLLDLFEHEGKDLVALPSFRRGGG